MKPKLFIGSSSESLDEAYAVQENLERYSEPTVWTQESFEGNKNSLEVLTGLLDNYDYAVFLFTPDDISTIRGRNYNVTRDNVIFEMGLFTGCLGKDKVFIIMPRGINKFHFPTDLIGVNPFTYDSKRMDGNLKAALGPVCNKIRNYFPAQAKVKKSRILKKAKRKPIYRHKYVIGPYYQNHESSEVIEVSPRTFAVYFSEPMKATPVLAFSMPYGSNANFKNVSKKGFVIKFEPHDIKIGKFTFDARVL